MSAHEERDWWLNWSWGLVRLLFWVLVIAAIAGTLFFGGSLLHGGQAAEQCEACAVRDSLFR